ncbi:glycoside hydrolase family 97 protein [Opacimonas viscosa]|uniref:Glycoside hydrolase family 97 protein n=1 Tax=Opacimonas viscosa TaxID=2961944 RepID=A0AA41X3K9_9ALTE|nr:glycoside hydrolase family 97 protein [Opacimonas viscosa]MCP3427949.1 glycoside hydrolase family 97 protein [Opacimonas viscosa]
MRQRLSFIPSLLTLSVMIGSVVVLATAQAVEHTAEHAADKSTEISVSSPDQDIVLHFTDASELAQYKVDYRGKALVKPSKLGFTFAQAKPLYRDFTVSEVARSSHNQTWEQPWGEQRLIDNHYNSVTVKFTHLRDKAREFSVEARVFDDGVAFRYHVPADGPRAITRELTEFFFRDSHLATAYWIPGQGRERYEYLYRKTPMQDMLLSHTPMTFNYTDGLHVSVHEAALVDYAGMSLEKKQMGRFEAKLAPRADGVLVRKEGSFTTPWRTITIADKAVDLIESYMALNLNEPNKLGDVSWVEPGKYLGIWWGMHIAKYTWGSGAKHGATTERTMEYMDFAAEHGFDGVLVEGWNTGWDGDWIANSELFSFTESYPDFDIEKVSEYGQKIGVRLIGHHETSGGITNYEAQMEDAFKLYEDLGVAQIKTGYVAHGQNLKRRDAQGIMRYEFTDSQDVVNHFIHNVATAAQYRLSINTHEAVKDTGLRRTYPNWISRESARGQEYNSGWAAVNPPSHIPTLTFTRMLSGPMDFTPGIFDLDYPPVKAEPDPEAGFGPYMRPLTTLAKQLAQYVVIYSPIQMAADLPQNYLRHPEAFQFIKDVPTDWEKTVALAGEIGEYVMIARQERKHRQYSGNDWYLGVITGDTDRRLKIALDFLKPGQKYLAHIYQDAKDTDYKTNPYAIDIQKTPVQSTDELVVTAKVAGGVAIRFEAVQ